MNNKHFLGQSISDFERYDDIGPITAVELRVDEKQSIWSGDKNGYVLEVECPYGTQAMADNILNSVKGKTYKSFRAKNAGLPITAELGDALTVNNVYTMFAYQHLNFGPNNRSEIAAPGSHEAEHEFPYISSTQKELNRLDNGIRSYITKTNEEIVARVEKVENGVTTIYSEIKENLDGIELNYQNLSKNLEDGLTEVNAQIKVGREGNWSIYTAKSEFTEVINKIIQDIDGINLEYVKKTEVDDKIQTEVTAQIKAGLEGIELDYVKTNELGKKVQSLITAKDTGINLITTSYEGTETLSASIVMTYNNIQIASQQISFTGAVTFNSLDNALNPKNGMSSSTVINGGLIKTGSIDADLITTGRLDSEYLNLYGPLAVYETSRRKDLTGFLGSVEGQAINEDGSVRTTYGIGIMAPGDASNKEDVEQGNINYYGGSCICTNSGARLTFGTDMFGQTCTIACVGSNKGMHCYSSQVMEVFSDKRLKNSIEYNILEKYEGFYKSLKPCRFKMNNEKEGKYKIGFVAQDVKNSLKLNRLELSDFSGLSQFDPKNPEEEGIYTLGYSEFISLNTSMIQHLMKEVEFLKNEIKDLRGIRQ